MKDTVLPILEAAACMVDYRVMLQPLFSYLLGDKFSSPPIRH